MSTRAQVRFATREDGVSFSEHPDKIHAQFYKHSDGYPEGLGVDIAHAIADGWEIKGWEIEHVQTRHGDLEYIYYIWSDYDKETWISIFEVSNDSYCDTCHQYTGKKGEDKCIFVGKPEKLINKYKLNTDEEG